MGDVGGDGWDVCSALVDFGAEDCYVGGSESSG